MVQLEAVLNSRYSVPATVSAAHELSKQAKSSKDASTTIRSSACSPPVQADPPAGDLPLHRRQTSHVFTACNQSAQCMAGSCGSSASSTCAECMGMPHDGGGSDDPHSRLVTADEAKILSAAAWQFCFPPANSDSECSAEVVGRGKRQRKMINETLDERRLLRASR